MKLYHFDTRWLSDPVQLYIGRQTKGLLEEGMSPKIIKIHSYITLLMALILPSVSISGEDWDCGAWTCSIHGAAWTHSEDHRYKIYLDEKNGECNDLSHELTSRGEQTFNSMIVTSDVQFVFNDGSTVDVGVISSEDQKLSFSQMSDSRMLQQYLRNKGSFEIKSGDQIISGPFGLSGSNRAISNIKCQ